jgi:hypothetical protein
MLISIHVDGIWMAWGFLQVGSAIIRWELAGAHLQSGLLRPLIVLGWGTKKGRCACDPIRQGLEAQMHDIIYLVGLVVVVLFILSMLGLR